MCPKIFSIIFNNLAQTELSPLARSFYTGFYTPFDRFHLLTYYPVQDTALPLLGMVLLMQVRKIILDHCGQCHISPSGYGAPDAGYGAPSDGYDSPDSGYSAPQSGYSRGRREIGLSDHQKSVYDMMKPLSEVESPLLASLALRAAPVAPSLELAQLS